MYADVEYVDITGIFIGVGHCDHTIYLPSNVAIDADNNTISITQLTHIVRECVKRDFVYSLAK